MPALRTHQSGQDMRAVPAEREAFTQCLIAAQEQERAHLARELHDAVGQTLLIIKNRAFLAKQLADVPVRATEQLNEIANMAMQALEEVRAISAALRPVQLDWMGLTEAIQAMVGRVGLAGGFKVIAEIDSLDRIFSPEHEIHLYRIVQESLTNVVKHARAARVEVRFKTLPADLSLSISDDGCGFDRSATGRNRRVGFGLTGISERVRIMKGQFLVHSQPAQGTRLEITLPLPAVPRSR